ncbi:MAG TPA: VCBS repeat-containing protein, partial [Pyrinomonadaceae bacterium]|nr:VCBS repeat-containing protein [Pyrinomonadaceae bacterium]
GEFTSIGGTSANRAARWNGTSWSALGDGLNALTNDVAIAQNGDVYVGGQFTTAGGVTANRIARWNGASWSALGTGMNGTVGAVEIAPNGDVYAGGGFTTANGATARRVARWNGTTWSALGTGTGEGLGTGGVNDMQFTANGDLIVAGTFTSAGPSTVGRIARWNGTAWSGIGSGLNNTVNAIRVVGNEIYAVGSFTQAGGSPASRLAMWNGSAWSEVEGGLSGTTNTIVFAGNGDLWAGGSFIRSGCRYSTGIARLRSNVAPPIAAPLFDFDGDGKTDISIFRAGPVAGEWWYLRSSDDGNRAFTFGTASDTLSPADFTGDGKTDIAFWRPASGEWFVLRSEDSTFFAFPFGAAGDVPSPADFDGDGKSDAT